MAIVNNHANNLHNFKWCDDVEVGLIDILLMSGGGVRCINATRDGLGQKLTALHALLGIKALSNLFLVGFFVFCIRACFAEFFFHG